MAKLLIIAGPQSSGKTTVFNLLKEKYPQFYFLPEINPFTLNKNHLGAAFIDSSLEKKICDQDIKILKKTRQQLECGRIRVLIQETGIFHLVYLETMFDKKTVDFYYQKYLKTHQPFHSIILFLDTKPEISWRRRKPYYLERIKKAGITDPREKQKMLQKYRQKIFQLYPLWLKWYKKFPFEKSIIKNSFKSYQRFIEEVMEKVVLLDPI